MVVTKKERISGKILSNNEPAISIKPDDAPARTIQRSEILQVFDDEGELIWQGELPPMPARASTAEQIPTAAVRTRAISAEFLLGGVTGGFFSEEQRLIDSMNITATYADGSKQGAQNRLLTMGVGLTYSWYQNARWATAVSYLYRETAHTVYTGDDKTYQKITFADERLSALHSLMYGRELHFYPGGDDFSFDLVGQAGYQVGNYRALSTYRSMYSILTPQPPAYNGATDIFIHGPTLRAGAGFTLRGAFFLFKIAAYYQGAINFSADNVVFTSGGSTLAKTEKVALLHDYYVSASLGFRWEP
ncbi:MAG: hypothetical protein JNJ69_03520 [Leptospiraceae bacterium]|nr:hypothetical protein [Leptospiraceae bacterium]